MIKVENLVKRYGSNFALNDVSFEIGEDSYKLYSHVCVIENIARLSEIEIDMLLPKKES